MLLWAIEDKIIDMLRLFGSVLAFAFAVRLFLSRSKSKVHWLTRLVLAAMLMFVGDQSTAWFVVSYYFRYLLIVLLIGALIYNYKHIINEEITVTRKKKIAIFFLYAPVMIFLLYFAVSCFGARTYEEEPVMLSFPFKNGTYAVTQGGNGELSHLLNYHMMGRYQNVGNSETAKYAMDFAKINNLGREKKLTPDNVVEAFEIYGEPIYSPCNGKVVSVCDHRPDRVMLDKGGNHIIILKEPDENNDKQIIVLLAHLKADTIKVAVGQTVEEGQLLAQAGASGIEGNAIPHLHMQANIGMFGESVPMVFDNKFLVKNDIVRK